MASGIPGDTIDEIDQRISSLPFVADTSEIRMHLRNIKELVVKVEHANKDPNNLLRDWRAKVNDLLKDLLDDLPIREDLLPSRSSRLAGRMTKLTESDDCTQDQILSKIRDSIGKLNKLAETCREDVAERVGEANNEETDRTNPYVRNTLLVHQKLCFAYCSLFPKGYAFDVPQLIYLWMAEGFLDFTDPTSVERTDEPEDRGQRFVFAFIRSNIFIDVEQDEISRIRTCKLDPRMHDLATIIARDESIDGSMSMNPDEARVPKGLRRVSFDYSLDIFGGIPDFLFSNAKKLHTILLPAITQLRLPKDAKITASICKAIFSNFKKLCVLDLHNLGIRILPSSISDLNDLKYLDLSENNIEKLPSSITKLTKLQTLRLSGCFRLQELPEDLKNLKDLRHLEIEGCFNLIHMPSTIKHLTSLRTLSHFMVSNSETGGLEELSSLTNLRGDLEILHLERLKSSKDSFLKDKELVGLTLRWYSDVNKKASQSNENDEYLKRLQLPEKLKVLSIVGFQGKQPQHSFSSLANLVKLSLYNCPGCERLPGLPKLKVLRLQRLQSLKFIDNHASFSSKKLMESLEELAILDCPNFTRWWEAEDIEAKFQKITKLEVRYCTNLTSMPINPAFIEQLVLVSSGEKPLESTIGKINKEQTKQGGTSTEPAPLSKLKYLQIADVKRESPDVWIRDSTSLEDLHIQECPLLKSLPNNLKYLERLTIENCKQLELSKIAWSGLESLNRLILREIPKMESFPSELERLKCRKLEIHDCRELKSLPATIRELTSLRKLVLSECNKLASLPKEIGELKSLETLIIRDCLLLLPRCQRETGDDWPHIREIKRLSLTQTSRGLEVVKATKSGSG